MPTFTPGQLNTGVDTTSLTGAITAQFQNPSGSAYFFLVQNTNKNADEYNPAKFNQELEKESSKESVSAFDEFGGGGIESSEDRIILKFK